MDDDRKFIGMRKGLVRERGKNIIKKIKPVRSDELEIDIIGNSKERYVYLKYGKVHKWRFRSSYPSWKLMRDKQYDDCSTRKLLDCFKEYIVTYSYKGRIYRATIQCSKIKNVVELNEGELYTEVIELKWEPEIGLYCFDVEEEDFYINGKYHFRRY